MKKEKIKNIVLIMVLMIITSTITSYATSSYLFDSVDVKYNNSNGVQAETVQGAIDELYSCASDYSSVNNKVSTLEGYFKYDPSSYFNGDSVSIARNSTNTSSLKQVELFSNGVSRASLYFHPSDDATYLTAKNSSGTWGQGTLVLYGNPVAINGVDVSNVSSGTATINTTNTLTGNSSSVTWVKIGRIVIVSLYDVGCKNNGNGVSILASGLPSAAATVTTVICGHGTVDYCSRIAINGTDIKWWWTNANSQSTSGQLIYISAN